MTIRVGPGPAGSVNGGATAPDLGADEFDGFPLLANDVQATAFIDPANGATKVAGGPFSPQGERALFAARGIDVLVSKNSGGRATEAKLAVARELRLPVVMLRRPPLPAAAREFDDTASALQALEDWLQPEQSLLNDTV